MTSPPGDRMSRERRNGRPLHKADRPREDHDATVSIGAQTIALIERCTLHATPRPDRCWTCARAGRWWSYLDYPTRWVVECDCGREVVNTPDPGPCRNCCEVPELLGEHLPDRPPVLFEGGTQCAACGEDLLDAPGLTSRCRPLHNPAVVRARHKAGSHERAELLRLIGAAA